MATSVKMGLLGRFFSEQRSFLNRAKGNVEVEDFFQFPGRVVLVPGSRGKLGGKAAGLFLAGCVVTRAAHEDPELEGVRTPLSWYLPSDALNAFLQYNDLEDLRLQKYRTPTEIVQDYPRIVQLMRDSRFPRDLVQGLAAALDGLGEVPLVVRSSSLLEDQAGAAFSGKYLSLFLGNQGDREQRLAALLGAVAEVYASTFCPDVIEYRGERGLLDLNEEMGILIQQVVGKRLGKYFLPAFAGVAFSRNEFRWSPRISREDGLVRLVPGLGTRAVDRLADDYPVLVAPGKPMLRVNSNTDEVMRYAPKKLDLINLDTGGFETLAFTDLVREIGEDYPNIKQIVSINRNGILHRPMGLATDYRKASMVVTFDGLIAASPFLGTIKKLLTLLEGQLGGPVDIEFASDGDHLYLLQCRPQSHVVDDAAVAIPAEISPEDLVFSANRFVSNGQIPDITHLVYVDPEGYDGLVERDSVLKIRESIGQLNKRLPRRQFILMGPGRWGSRGDIKLGVPVTYSEINNTAMLIEIARRKGDYQPDLSFGTHFFQDLVEASIRYLPLYPDDPGSVLNVDFIRTAPNALEQIVPEAASVADVVRVIDIPAAANHRVLRLLANAEAELAVGILVDRSEPVQLAGSAAPTDRAPDEHSIWRIRMAKELASRVDPARFGVVAVYVIGSTMNETAGPASDIDLVIHVRNDPERQAALESWLDGWNHSLAVSNLLRTGHKTAALLDLHFVTDSDIEQQTSFAVMIGTPRAQELPILR